MKHPGVKAWTASSTCSPCLRPCLLKTCLFTSRAQQVFEQSERWKCGSYCCCETHLLKCSQFLNKTRNPVRVGCATVSFLLTVIGWCQHWKDTFHWECNTVLQEILLQFVLKQIIQLHTFILLVSDVLIAMGHGAFTVHLLLSLHATKSVYCFVTTFSNNKVEANQSK